MTYPHLFSPLGIGSAVFRNRILSAPQGNYNNRSDNLPSAECIAFYERKAIGGFASVSVGDCIVDCENGIHFPFLFKMQDANTKPGLSALASAINRNGAVSSAELSHAGQRAEFVFDQHGRAFGPSADPNWKFGEVLEMPEEMIYKIIDDFGKAAAWVKECGFRMVTVHGGHGWLLTQFMSPLFNKRTDSWGGSHEKRMRFPLAVVESIRKAAGRNFPIEMRISGDERDANGYDIDYGIKIAESLDQKVDIIHVSAGIHDYARASYYTHPNIFLEDGVNSEFAIKIKQHVKSYVATVGAFTDPEMMEEYIASGKVDFIALGRQSMADPDFPNKARTGNASDIDKCLRCLSCFGSIGNHRYPQCALNPEISHELEAKLVKPATVKKRVLIAGGGIAGLQAALTAAKRGHETILCEKTAELGGILRCEKNVPFKKRLDEYIDRQVTRVYSGGVDVRLNSKVNAELVKKLAPDVLIAALGGVSIKPDIPGIDNPNVYRAEEIYSDTDKASGRVVIIGAGLSGLELAVHLSQLGYDVEIIEAADKPGNHGPHGEVLLFKLEDLGIKLSFNAPAKEITGSSVIADKEYPCDTVIYATGIAPLREDAFALSSLTDEFYQIGDCITQGTIMDANLEAWTIANRI